MRFKAHESFSIRKGWLYKGLKNVIEQPDIFSNKSLVPTDILGIGNNMVRSLRYWLQVTGLTYESNVGGRHQELTELAHIIWEYDQYMEETGTLWLLHYKLSTQQNDATAWYYLFNEFDLPEFNKEDFVDMINLYTKINGMDVAESSIEGDFDCLIKTYISRNDKDIDPEDNIECPLSELGLLDVLDKKSKTYHKITPKKGTLHPLILFAVIVDNTGSKEIKISSLLNDKNNVGKVFNLDIITLMELLYELQKVDYIKVNRTAGLDVITINKDITFEQAVREYYISLNQ